MSTRNLMAELQEGTEARAEAREGKRTLRTHHLDVNLLEPLAATEVLSLRERLNFSRAYFARMLRINPRTLENWEQGRAKPNPQANLLLRLVEKYPATLTQIQSL